MPGLQDTVFISYRRSTGSFIARSIFEDLRSNGFDPFMDVESIDSGTFDTIILNQIAARAHFVLILSPGTLDRVTEEGDWLRREIEVAIDLKRNIVPVLVGDFVFTNVENLLSGKLAELPRYNALRMFHEYFDEAMERLRKRYLKQPVYGDIKQVSAKEQEVVQQQIERLTTQGSLTNNLLLSPEVQLARALKLERRGDLQGAIASYSKVIEVNPEYPNIYTYRAKARVGVNDIEGALVDMDKAIRINPRDTEAFIQRGLIYLEQTQFEQALLDFKGANNLRPGDMMILACLAVVDHALDQLKEAERLWELLIKLDANYQDAGWVQRQFKWSDIVTEEARKLVKRVAQKNTPAPHVSSAPEQGA
ncbi:MAG: toll/interleukin-1 receptor domain-containing protein [Chloroflexi bacterium]|nr:toll/interleukin-1 receptor domain-containing protein [Chloroflexota bacterium]